MTHSLAAWGLVLNAFVWGVSWYPFRLLEAEGLHPLWSTAIIYGLALLALLVWRPGSWRALLHHPLLWLLMLASGLTNVGFNWAVTIGDVVHETYLVGPRDTPDPSAWRTEIGWPVLRLSATTAG